MIKCLCEKSDRVGYSTSVHLPSDRNMVYYCPECMADVWAICTYATVLARERHKNDENIKEKYKDLWFKMEKKYPKFGEYNWPEPKLD